MNDPRLKLLVIDDDPLVVQSLRISLPTQWIMMHACSIQGVPQGEFSAALVDMHLSNDLSKTEGLQVIKYLRKRDPHFEIVAMSGNLDRELMEACLLAGATRFLAKPLNHDELQMTLDKIEALRLLCSASRRSLNSRYRWIGASPASQGILKKIAQLRSEPGPILIEGESGVGKEVIAQLIHRQDGEGRPFVTLNVAAVPETLFESELFGHIRGSFTGAEKNKMGLAEAAHGGDLFLDEIEALPLVQQAKLLRFLETGELRRVGAHESIRVKTRVIAATNQNLAGLVREGKFREDLLWRLQGKSLSIPPLRDRRDDIDDLAPYFLESESPRRKKSFTPDALDLLKTHDWPGNVRELKRVCEQLSLYSPLPIIRAEDVRKFLLVLSEGPSLPRTLDFSVGLSRMVADFEAKVIRTALSHQTDVGKTAEVLQVSRSNLYKKIKDHNIDI